MSGSRPPSAIPELTLVVPTRDEAQAVGRLRHTVAGALAGVDWELIFVDDSEDETKARLAAMAARDARVRVLHREGVKGLGTAIVAGFRLARGRFVCVLDADGQHPPDLVPRLLAAARQGADLAVASRFAAYGSLGDLPRSRRLLARFGRAWARIFLPAARATSDPLSGFFLCRRDLVAGRPLRPVGWKILLEVLVVCRPHRVADVPYRFRRRALGQSKLGAREATQFLAHVASLALRSMKARTPLAPTPATRNMRGSVVALADPAATGAVDGGAVAPGTRIAPAENVYRRNLRPVLIGLCYTLAVRIALLAVALIAIPIPSAHTALPHAPLDLWRQWAQWDGIWYENIAQRGYGFSPNAFAFFPLYPLLLRYSAWIFGRNLTLAGIVISAIASTAAFALLYARVARDHGEAIAERTVRYLAIFPTGFFLATVYTEATFLALALGTLVALSHRRWGLAALAGAAAALTRNVGVALALPAAWTYVTDGRRESLGSVAAVTAGFASFIAFAAWLRGDPLAFLHAQYTWNRHLTWPWTTASLAVHAAFFGPHAGANAVDLAVTAGVGAALLAGRRVLSATDQLWGWAMLALTVAAPVRTGHMQVLLSATRLLLVAYPAFIVLARWGENPWVDRTLSVAFPLIQGAAFVLFTHAFFVA